MSIAKHLLWPVLALGLVLSACSNSDDAPNKLASLTDTPLPRGYDLDAKETIVFGEADRWTGRVYYTINSNADDMLEYLRREMPSFGWTELALLRANVSVMTFTRSSRVATIQIRRGKIYGSSVEMVVAPMTVGGGQSSSAAPSSGGLRADELPPPPPKGPNRAVSVEPVK